MHAWSTRNIGLLSASVQSLEVNVPRADPSLRTPARPSSGRAPGCEEGSIRQPLGVVAGITPFNFPAMVPMWMYPLAIACRLRLGGRGCMAISVLVTVGDAADRVLPKIRERVRQLKVAPGLEPGAEMGPLVTKEHHARVASYVERGQAEGAELVEDGRALRVPGHEGGFFLGPCLFDRVTPA